MAAQVAGDDPDRAEKMGASAQVGDDEPARHAVQPPVQRFVKVGAGPGGRHGCAHQDEHGNGQKAEAVQVTEQGLRHEVQHPESLEDHEEPHGHAAQRKGHGHADHEEANCDDEDNQSQGEFAHLPTTSSSARPSFRPSSSAIPNGGSRPVRTADIWAISCRLVRVSPIGIDM